MNVRIVAIVMLSIAVLGLLIAPAALAYSDRDNALAGGEQKQVKGPTMKISPTPKKTTPTPVMKKAISPTKKVTPTITAMPMKKQVRIEVTATPKPTTTMRHGNVTGVPTTPAGEPMGIGMKNITVTPRRG